MKVTVTHLKAPWPAGAAVGSVVELPGDTIPAWAVGKCTPADADAEASHVWEPPAPAVETPAEAPKADAAEALQIAQNLLAAAEQENAELRARVEKAEAAAGELAQLLDAAKAENAELRAAPKPAEAAQADAAAAATPAAKKATARA